MLGFLGQEGEFLCRPYVWTSRFAPIPHRRAGSVHRRTVWLTRLAHGGMLGICGCGERCWLRATEWTGRGSEGRMNPETIWISRPSKLENQHGFSVAPGATKAEKLPFQEDRLRAAEAGMRMARGERLATGDVTTRLIHFFPGRQPFTGAIPPVIANAGVFLRQDVLQALQEFDLGDAQTFPVDLFDTTPDKPMGVTVWLLNPVNTKATVDPDLSGLERPRLGTMQLDVYHAPIVDDHSKIRTFASALDGPDLWIDPRFFQSMFFSDRLARRLIAAGWQSAFELFPTTLIR
jgi:hypothetical protein